MNWTVELQDDFSEEFESFSEQVQDSIVEKSNLLKRFGTQLGRPIVDTLNGSDFSNMKELRFNVGQEIWRVAFAFDPARKAILLVGANKRGKNQKRFYKDLIRIADNRYLEHLINLKNKK